MSTFSPSMISTNWPAPAKLNLFLHINGRRADGYHELQTLFQFVDRSDRLDFEILPTTELELISELNKLVPPNDNLILKAAKLLQQHCQSSLGARISLHKILPMGGGLGGGSSNAATTLVALNHLWKTNLSIDELATLGVRLGADVPVFIRGIAAFAEGVGEKLQAVEIEQPWYLVLAPQVHVSTAEIFQDPELPRSTAKLELATLMNNPWHNDCEKLVCKRYPQVANALARLLEYAPSRMTGTGGCVFGTFASQQQALDALAQLPSEYQGFVAQGLNLSPLVEHLASR